MARKRIVKTYSDTSAKGERTPIEDDRYFVKIDLVSVKMEERADLVGTSEIYFKCGGKGLFRSDRRTPDLGTINLELNEVFVPDDRLTLYSAFIDQKGGGSIEIPFDVMERDIGKKDSKLIDTQISINLGSSMEYYSFLENGVKVKIGASAIRSRY